MVTVAVAALIGLVCFLAGGLVGFVLMACLAMSARLPEMQIEL